MSEAPQRDRDVERLYQALRRLESGVGGKRVMSQCTGRQQWPDSGIYFFFEPEESRTNTTERRVVRVGTHRVGRGSKTKLWTRLRAHRGTRAGNGNHRGSIFRLHVGAAISARDADVMLPSWSVGQAADATLRNSEAGLERRVSGHIGTMSVLCVAVEDEPGPASDRAYIERNVISLLVGKSGPLDPPSEHWLGKFSPDERIRKSGLWNLNFLDYSYSSVALDVLDEYVSATIGITSPPSRRLAPPSWYDEQHQVRQGTNTPV